MHRRFVTGLAALLLVTGCSAAQRPADNSGDEAPIGSPMPGPDGAENMSDTTNAMENASDNMMENAASNAADNSSGNTVTVAGPNWCPILKRVATPADCTTITQQANNLEAGLGAFNVPDTMVLNEPAEVKFAVGTVDAAEETAANAGTTIARSVQVKTKLGRYMTATLSGSGFKIDATGSPERDLGASASEVWVWTLLPLRKGKLDLLLTVSVEAADAAGKRTRIKLATRTVPVEVGVTAADRRRETIGKAKAVADDTEPLLKSWGSWFATLALLIGGISAVVIAIRAFGKRKDPPAPPAPPKDGAKP